ncbi:MAG: FtsX-like permease family protein [Candidatus Cryptobacteroides sp.]|nr:FtsX-like permease family protein [Candidatus Cryptobacteroides sp.]
MHLPLFIARRYLFAKKSHNVINIISAISAVGMAIGTAALIIILSIYNGFDELVKSTLSNVEPDILITPAKGKVFIPEGEAFDRIKANPMIGEYDLILQENVFVDYDGHQGIAKAKGVDSAFEAESPLAEHITNGEFSLHKGQLPQMVVGAGLAYKMGMNPAFLASAELYFPIRDRNFSLANPAASIETVRMRPSGIFSVNQQIDDDLMIVPIEEMRKLLGYEEEVSGVEIRLAEGSTAKDIRSAIKHIQKELGPEFKVLDRFRQNTSLYKMMRYEKAAIFLILIFVIIIIALNIFGSITMLIIEKKDDIETYRSLGATDQMLRRTFTLEGWLISLLGLAAGLVVGIGFSLAQQHFGFIKMPGSFLVNAYPVILQWQDVLATIAGVALIGYIIALLPVRRNIR